MTTNRVTQDVKHYCLQCLTQDSKKVEMQIGEGCPECGRTCPCDECIKYEFQEGDRFLAG